MTNIEILNDLSERAFHSDTMKALSPLEAQWLIDMDEHRQALPDHERDCWDAIEQAPQ